MKKGLKAAMAIKSAWIWLCALTTAWWCWTCWHSKSACAVFSDWPATVSYYASCKDL